MKPHDTITIPEEIAKQYDKEWSGTYEIHILNAREYLEAAEELVQEIREKGEYNGTLPEFVLQYHIVCKAVKHNGQPLNPKGDIPSKIYELLQFKALPLNTLTKNEATSFFQSSQVTKKPQQD